MRSTQDEDGYGMITVRALGASEIRIGKRRIPAGAEVVFALALYLCTRAGERLTRDELCEVFWGTASDAQGRHSLRQMLYRLRQHGLTLDEDGEQLYLDPARVDSDLSDALKESWVTTADPAAIEAAQSLAPGFTRHISERFQEWFDIIRDRLVAQHRRAALRQLVVARREGRWVDLDTWALQILMTDPLNEEATLARAESAAMAGSKTIALEIIDAYIEELGDRASAIGLPATVLRRRIAERAIDWADRRTQEVPFVGRRELMSRLTGLVDSSASGEGRAVVLWGAPGIGKTRLAQEIRSYAELRGFYALTVRARSAHVSRPLSTVLTLIPLLRSLPGAAGSDPSTLALLDHVLAASAQHADYNLSTTVESLRDALVASFEDLIAAVAAERRLFIMVDDLHNADDASQRILTTLFAGTASSPVMWLCTSRTRFRAASGLSNADMRFISLNVPALNDLDVIALANSMAEQFPNTLQPTDIHAVARIAGGNPLFVRELSLHRAQSGVLTSLPKSLSELIGDRLQSMDASTTRVLQVITLLGNLATPPRVKALVCSLTIDIVAIVERLEAEGVLHLNGMQVLDLHDCWQQVVADDMTSATRAALSLECALQLTSAEESQRSEVTWKAASLYAAAGAHSTAANLFLACGREMTERGLPQEASEILERALELTASDDERHTALAALARAHFCNGDLEAVIRTVDSAFALRPRQVQEQLVAHTGLLALRCESRAKLHLDHRDDLASLARFAKDRRLPPSARQAVCLAAIGLVYTDRASPLEDILFEASLEATQESGETTVGCLVSLIYFAERGEADDVRRINSILQSLEHEDLPAVLRCRALRYRTSAMRFIGEHLAVAELAERAFASAVANGLVVEAMRTAETMAFAGLDLEDEALTEVWLSKWKRLRIRPAHAQLEQALTHVTGRLYAQRGEFARALEAYSAWTSSKGSDLMQMRHAVDIATLALITAGIGRANESLAFLQSLEPIVQSSRASFQMDYVVEMCLRAFSQLGDVDNRRRIGRAYCERRRAEFKMPFRPFSRELLGIRIHSSPS